jgi:hypothetical protein
MYYLYLNLEFYLLSVIDETRASTKLSGGEMWRRISVQTARRKLLVQAIIFISLTIFLEVKYLFKFQIQFDVDIL